MTTSDQRAQRPDMCRSMGCSSSSIQRLHVVRSNRRRVDVASQRIDLFAEKVCINIIIDIFYPYLLSIHGIIQCILCAIGKEGWCRRTKQSLHLLLRDTSP